jgi:hypothetical protein
MTHSSFKRFMRVLWVSITCISLFIGSQLWLNNIQSPNPEKIALEKSFSSAARWLAHHKDEILNEENPILWWMVKQAAIKTEDKNLTQIYIDYEKKYLSPRRNNAWIYLFKPENAPPISSAELSHLPDYNQFVLYGASCSGSLEESKAVQSLLKVDFCASHMLSPACVTHQMMGFLFMRRSGCRNPESTSASILELQDKLVTQLTYDFRVVDVYLQRILMLEESGAHERIQPIWISRVISAQNEDGGWSGFSPLTPVGNGYYFGYSRTGIGISENTSDFHATAQGVYLMSLLLGKTP